MGVIHYNGWVTEHERNPNVLDWLVLCGTNGATRAFDGLSSDTPTNIATKEPKKFTGTIPLYVNHGREHEKSDFAVMEVITWDRVLSQEEMLATVDYLKWKLRAGAVLEASEHLATESQHNLDSWGVQDLDNMQSKTTEVTFANGYKADLAGWTHTRYYARGFITNSKDVATAVVKGLSPAAQYLYQIYMVHEMSNWQGEAQVSVNHGVQARVQQNGINEHAYGGQFATIVCSEGLGGSGLEPEPAAFDHVVILGNVYLESRVTRCECNRRTMVLQTLPGLSECELQKDKLATSNPKAQLITPSGRCRQLSSALSTLTGFPCV